MPAAANPIPPLPPRTRYRPEAVREATERLWQVSIRTVSADPQFSNDLAVVLGALRDFQDIQDPDPARTRRLQKYAGVLEDMTSAFPGQDDLTATLRQRARDLRSLLPEQT